MSRATLVLGLFLSLASTQAGKPEATSLLGKPLHPAPMSAEARKTLDANLKAAEVEYGKNPDDPDATIWIGRRVAYLGRYREAIDHFSDGVEKHPVALLQHRPPDRRLGACCARVKTGRPEDILHGEMEELPFERARESVVIGDEPLSM